MGEDRHGEFPLHRTSETRLRLWLDASLVAGFNNFSVSRVLLFVSLCDENRCAALDFKHERWRHARCRSFTRETYPNGHP